MTILAICVAALSIVGATLTIVSKMLDLKTSHPGAYKKVKVSLVACLGLIAVALVLFVGMWIQIATSWGQTSQGQNSDRPRVVLLLPAGSKIKSVREDARHQLLGMLDYLENRWGDSMQVDFVVRCHEMDYSVADRVIAEEMRAGTKYFVVTMSKIATYLSTHWPELCETNNRTGQCFLFATVASSPNITKAENVFRFYIRSEDESTCLAQAIDAVSGSTAIAICVDDSYGRGAATVFRNAWVNRGGILLPTHIYHIGSGAEPDEIDSIFEAIGCLPADQRKYAFVANYGEGISRTIKELHIRSIHPYLLLTSTFSIQDWREPVDSILHSFNWLTVRPDYTDSTDTGKYNDVVRDFTYFTMVRVAECAEQYATSETNMGILWSQTQFPKPFLEYSVIGTHDVSIPLKKWSDSINDASM